MATKKKTSVKTKKVKIQKKKSFFSKKTAIPFAILFGIVGAYMVFRIFAYGQVELKGNDGEYTYVMPTRVFDSRLGNKKEATVNLYEKTNLPKGGIKTAVYNVTIPASTNATNGGSLTIYSGGTRPRAKSLIYSTASTVTTMVSADVLKDGIVKIFNEGSETPVFVDLIGYYSSETGPDGGRYEAISPVRLKDTNSSALTRTIAIPARTSRSVNIRTTMPNLPKEASVISLGLRAVKPAADGYLSVSTNPASFAKSNYPAVSYNVGKIASNTQNVTLATGEYLYLNNNSDKEVNVTVDVYGYYKPQVVGGDRSQEGRFSSQSPKVIFDKTVPASIEQNFSAKISYEDNADTIMLRMHVKNPTKNGSLIVYSAASKRGKIATVNYVKGQSKTVEVAVLAAQYTTSSLYLYSSSEVQVTVQQIGNFKATETTIFSGGSVYFNTSMPFSEVNGVKYSFTIDDLPVKSENLQLSFSTVTSKSFFYSFYSGSKLQTNCYNQPTEQCQVLAPGGTIIQPTDSPSALIEIPYNFKKGNKYLVMTSVATDPEPSKLGIWQTTSLVEVDAITGVETKTDLMTSKLSYYPVNSYVGSVSISKYGTVSCSDIDMFKIRIGRIIVDGAPYQVLPAGYGLYLPTNQSCAGYSRTDVAYGSSEQDTVYTLATSIPPAQRDTTVPTINSLSWDDKNKKLLLSAKDNVMVQYMNFDIEPFEYSSKYGFYPHGETIQSAPTVDEAVTIHPYYDLQNKYIRVVVQDSSGNYSAPKDVLVNIESDGGGKLTDDLTVE